MPYSALNNLDFFDINMRITQEYCACQMLNGTKSPAATLRSLDTDTLGGQLWQYRHTQHEIAEWCIDPREDNVVAKLFQEQIMRKRQAMNSVDISQGYNGRILVTDYENTITDGASEAESEGFIDVYDLPPIDTWFFLSVSDKQKLLYSWVPEAYCDLVNEAIEVNAVDMMWWMDAKHDSWFKKLFL